MGAWSFITLRTVRWWDPRPSANGDGWLCDPGVLALGIPVTLVLGGSVTWVLGTGWMDGPRIWVLVMGDSIGTWVVQWSRDPKHRVLGDPSAGWLVLG